MGKLLGTSGTTYCFPFGLDVLLGDGRVLFWLVFGLISMTAQN